MKSPVIIPLPLTWRFAELVAGLRLYVLVQDKVHVARKRPLLRCGQLLQRLLEIGRHPNREMCIACHEFICHTFGPICQAPTQRLLAAVEPRKLTKKTFEGSRQKRLSVQRLIRVALVPPTFLREILRNDPPLATD